MKIRYFRIAAFVIAFAAAAFGCAGGGAARGNSAPPEVFQNGNFTEGAKLGEGSSPVSLSGQKIRVVPVPVPAGSNKNVLGWDYTFVIEFDEAIDISRYNNLMLNWEGIYGGSFGGVAMTAIITTSDNKKTGSIGEWTQQADLGKVIFNFIGEKGMKPNPAQNDVAYRQSNKTCKRIELNCDYAMRAGGEDEGWQWFTIDDFDDLEPWFITELVFF